MLQRKLNWLKRFATGAVLLYAALVIGWYVAYLLVGDGYWLMGLLNAFAIYLFAPLPLATLVTVLIRHRGAAVVLLAVTILFLGLFGPDFIPPSPTVRAGGDAPTLTVMTYNVLYTTTDATPIAENVTRNGPDVVAFEELTRPLAEQLEHEIGTHYPYHTPMHDGCRAEVAVWSRYPLQVETLNRDVLCRARSVVLDLDGHAVRVVAVHAWPYTALDRDSVEQSFQWRQEQIEDLLKFVNGRPEPLVLLGDLNSTPTHEVYRTLSIHLQDAFREAGWGLGHTFPAQVVRAWRIPSPARLIRIDHIFHSAGWRAEAAWVGKWDGSSDHLPVVARLRLLASD